MSAALNELAAPRSPAADSESTRWWTRLTRSRSFLLGAAVVGLFVLTALLADWVSPYGPRERFDGADRNAPPSVSHPLGTDKNTYDVLTRVIYGSRLSLIAGGLSILLAVGLGTPAGAIAGYFGGWIDTGIMRTIDVLLAFPSILIALLVVTALTPGWTAVILAVGLINLPVFARQVRATVLTIREQEYVTAAVAVGATPLYVLTRVLLPALMNPVIVLATLGLGSAILEVAALAFLGIGDVNSPEWGAMLGEARESLNESLWPALAPGAAISLTILGFNLLGDGLRDALDPHVQVD